MSTLIEDIRSYCAARGIKPSTLGLHAVADGKFFSRLSEGGRCWPETEERVRSYMAANPPADRAQTETGAAQ